MRSARAIEVHRQALLLDLDGTLADSLGVMRQVYCEFLRSFGKLPSNDEFEKLNGPPLADVVVHLALSHEIDVPKEILLRTYRDMVERVYQGVKPRPGAVDLLDTARFNRYLVSVVTSNTTGLVKTWLRAVGLDRMVDVVVGGDEVNMGKPHPEPYLKALEQTGCKASDSLAVEDSIVGARSAVAAGLRTFLIAVPPIKFDPELIVIDHLDQVTEFIATGRIDLDHQDSRT